MKKIMIALILASLSSASHAGVNDWKSKCKTTAVMAERLMQYRQEGIPLSIVLDVSSGDKNFDSVMEIIAVDAWEIPVMDDSGLQKAMVTQFKDKWYLTCVKEMRPKK